jgi:acyl-CoA reductase-like NAD-dependent aldehyde dehydrogenase
MGIQRLAHYLGGSWVGSTANGWHPDVNPSQSDEVLAEVPDGGASVVDQAVAAAHSATSRWAITTGAQRAEVLYKAAHLLSEQRQHLGLLVAREVGKPITEALQEVERGVAILRYFAGAAVQPIGAVIPAQQSGSLQLTLRQPLGPIALISPWNFPLAIPLWKMALALAFGNTVIWKPTEVASSAASALVQVFAAAGLPAGVLNLVLGKGTTTGAALIEHRDIRAITFTGSNTVGMAIAGGDAPLQIESDLFVLKQFTVLGIFGANTSAWTYAVDLFRAGLLHLAPLISHRFPADKYEAALETVATRVPGTLKVLVTHNGRGNQKEGAAR